MIENQNNKVTERLHEDLKFSPATALPNKVNGSLQPVIIANPNKFVSIVKYYNSSTTQVGATIYTTPSQKDFYLTGLTLSNMQNNTSDNTAVFITGYINNEEVRLITLAKLTTTAYDKIVRLEFPYPVKLDRNSNLRFYCAFTAGASTSGVTLQGYTVEIPRK